MRIGEISPVNASNIIYNKKINNFLININIPLKIKLILKQNAKKNSSIRTINQRTIKKINPI